MQGGESEVNACSCGLFDLLKMENQQKDVKVFVKPVALRLLVLCFIALFYIFLLENNPRFLPRLEETPLTFLKNKN